MRRKPSHRTVGERLRNARSMLASIDDRAEAAKAETGTPGATPIVGA